MDLLVMRRILFQPSPQLEAAIQELQADIKTAGPDITRTQALRFFAELGRERWHHDKKARRQKEYHTVGKFQDSSLK
jgi:hypothetical protein